MENMLKYDFMKYRHRLLYYRVAPTYKFDHCAIAVIE